MHTANGLAEVQCDAKAYTKELELHIYAKLVKDSPATLSSGKLRGELGCSQTWNPGDDPQSCKHGVVIGCRSDKGILVVAVKISPWCTPEREEIPCLSGCNLFTEGMIGSNSGTEGSKPQRRHK